MLAFRKVSEISVRTVRTVRTVQKPDLTGLPSDAADAPAELSDAWTDAETQQMLGDADALDALDAPDAEELCSDGGLEEMEWSG